jgi:hypothetical protein
MVYGWPPPPAARMVAHMHDAFADRLARSYAAVAGELPEGWTLSLRCASTGLAAEQRSEAWLAVAEGPANATMEGRGPDPERALAALHARLNR